MENKQDFLKNIDIFIFLIIFCFFLKNVKN